MKPAQRFEDLMVWQKSHQLVLRVYRLTSEFPKREIYGLAAQMRRVMISPLPVFCLLPPASGLLFSVSCLLSPDPCA